MPPIKIDSGLYSLYNMPNPNGGLSKMGNAYDMMGLIASFDQNQRNTIQKAI